MELGEILGGQSLFVAGSPGLGMNDLRTNDLETKPMGISGEAVSKGSQAEAWKVLGLSLARRQRLVLVLWHL